MRCIVEDVEFMIVLDPLQGLCVSATHVGERTASDFTTIIPVETDQTGIAKAVVEMFTQVHPERRPKP